MSDAATDGAAVTARPRRPTVVRRLRAHARNGAPVAALWLRRTGTTIRTVTLTVGAFGCFTAAGWEVAPPLGLAVAGAGLLVLNEMAGSDEPAP
jgi:hypothetical protein